MLNKQSKFVSRLLMGSFFLASVAFFSCNNETNSDAAAKASADSIAKAKAADSASKAKAAADTSKPKTADSTNKPGDTTKMDKSKVRPTQTNN